MVFGPPDPLGLHSEIVRALLGLARRAARPDDELPYTPIRTFAAEYHVGTPFVKYGQKAPHLGVSSSLDFTCRYTEGQL